MRQLGGGPGERALKLQDIIEGRGLVAGETAGRVSRKKEGYRCLSQKKERYRCRSVDQQFIQVKTTRTKCVNHSLTVTEAIPVTDAFQE